MGLDFGIQRRRLGAGYEGLAWEDVCDWRNCHRVKQIFKETIDCSAKDGYYPISTGAIQILIGKLNSELQTLNFNDMYCIDEYAMGKLLVAIADLSYLLADALYECNNEDIVYEYRVYDSY